MEKINKYKEDDIVYSVDVTEYLVVNINQLIVTSFFFNELPEYNKFIYSCDGLGQIVVRDFELPETEEEKATATATQVYKSHREEGKRHPSRTISTSSSEDYLFTKDDLEENINRLIEERKQMNKRIAEEAELFRCPLTNGKMKHDDSRRHHVMDGPMYYKVEGSPIVWELWPYAEGVYETNVNSVQYEYKYLGDGKWEKTNN